MRTTRFLTSLVLVFAASLAFATTTGCKNETPASPSGQSTPSLPGFVMISTNGGSAAGVAGQNGGNAGAIAITVSNGRIITDDGRARPTIDDNVIGTQDDDGVVTLADLEAIAVSHANVTATTGGMVRTFTIIGNSDFQIAAGVTLDLSDATPGVIDAVAITTNSAGGFTRIDGSVVATRTGANAVAVGFGATLTPGLAISIDGSITTAGDAGFNGGQFLVASSLGTVIVNGAINTEGGAGAAGLNGGVGGPVTITCPSGDLVLRGGTIRAMGGAGNVAGGTGGSINVNAAAAATMAFDFWGFDSSGGAAETTGTGGNAGDQTVTINGEVSWFARFIGNGGASVDGVGGAGSAMAVAGTRAIGGTVYLTADAGDSGTATGGTANNASFSATELENVRAIVECNGGDGLDGTTGGGINVIANRMISVTVEVTANGGTGNTTGSGGGGGAIDVLTSGRGGFDFYWEGVSVNATANGGNAADTGDVNGGSGGTIRLINQGTGAGIATNLSVTAVANGGDASSGGAGGTIVVTESNSTESAGNLLMTLAFTANGGAGTASGGAGGTIGINYGGDVTASFNGSADGGVATTDGNNSGNGGTIQLNSGDGSLGGSLAITGTLTANGAIGANGVNGGPGGQLQCGAGAGTWIADGLTVTMNGGTSGTADGGNGGAVTSTLGGAHVMIRNTTITANGANGGSNAGAAGTINLVTGGLMRIDSTATFNFNGADSTATGGGGRGPNINFTGQRGLIFDATLSATGGDTAAAQLGGDGGTVVLEATFGNLYFDGSINTDGGNSAGSTGGVGGTTTMRGDGSEAVIDGRVTANGGTGVTISSGGTIRVGGTGGDGERHANITLLSGTFFQANGAPASGPAGTITLDPDGTGPNNPALVEFAGATLETLNGDGTDGGNVFRD